jgi:Zn-dependent protease
LLAVAILLAWLALGVVLDRAEAPGVLVFGFVMVGWILAVMVHEFGHALVAWLGGDHTVAARGYLTLDPRLYVDVGTSLVLPLIVLALGGIGFPGAAVYLRLDLMRNRWWRAAASLGGPLGTLLVLLVLAGALQLLVRAEQITWLAPAVAFLAYLQATALILNLLPVPGLDGFNALRPFLPRAWAPALRRIEGLAFIVLLGVIFFVPGAGEALFGTAADLAFALGVDRGALAYGLDAFRFWQ